MAAADFSRELPPELAGKRIAVLGAGREGTATATWLIERGTVPTVCDRRERSDLGKTYDELTGLGVTEWQLGEGYLDGLVEDGKPVFDLVFRTPFLPAHDDRLEAARAAGVTVTSLTKLFFELCPASIVGVTGTKGKGTTAGLLHEMLTAGGKRSFLGGNIGTPPLEFLDELTADSIVVLELSSFQLEDLERSPQVAIVTNVTADHLDRHESVEEYRAAKRPILAYQEADGLAILNQDDPGAKAMAEFAGGPVAWFSTHRPVSDGAYADGAGAEAALVLAFGDDPGEICKAGQLLVPGPHNRANVLAAAVAAARLGVSREAMRKAAVEYRGLPYHLEFIGEHDGVRFFNDSYAANPTATIPAIESFEQPVVLIAGGLDRQLDFDELAERILTGPVRVLVSLGAAGRRLAETVESLAAATNRPAPESVIAADKESLKPLLKKTIQSGDVVLFSPAAPSFDWFDNFTARGKFFTELVKSL